MDHLHSTSYHQASIFSKVLAFLFYSIVNTDHEMVTYTAIFGSVELACRLRRESVATGPIEKDRLPMLLNGQEMMWAEPFYSGKYSGNRPAMKSITC